MYLSRLFLNPISRQVRSELANPYEMHRTVMHAFIGRLEKDERVLFRLETHPRIAAPLLLVQSPLEPDWAFLSLPEKNYLLPLLDCPEGVKENPAVKTFQANLRPGQNLMFRLLANPTVKKGRADTKQGYRLGLVREEDQLKWLGRKLAAAGASLLSARASNQAKLAAQRKRSDERQNLTLLAVQFDGLLTVQEPQKLLIALQSGIGSAKGLGFGLLSLAPVRG